MAKRAQTTLGAEYGHATVEFALVIPVLCLVILFGLLYAHALERTQWASQLSRETASLSFRLCAPSRGDVLVACLQAEVIRPIADATEGFIEDAGFVVSVFSYDEANGVARLEAIEAHDERSTDIDRFTGSGLNKSTLDAEIRMGLAGSPGMALKEKGVLVVAAVFLPVGDFVTDLATTVGLELPRRITATTFI